MNVILSRKGFDSKAGGGPSPILPDGTLLSLPIPSDDADCFAELRHGGHTYAQLLEMLGLRSASGWCHVDPDLRHEVKPRKRGWRGGFGQANAALEHLHGHRVGARDLFLFFGWFRATRWESGRLRFDGPNLHVIFGYLQVDSELALDGEHPVSAWASDHPHVVARRLDPCAGDSLFIARPRLSWVNRPGHGVFDYHPDLVLTKTGHTRSHWDLPREVFRDATISYHPSPWRRGYFQSAGRGQEFVVPHDSGVSAWARALVARHASLAPRLGPGSEPETGYAGSRQSPT
ncbi:MAG: hypothetical protein ACOYOB_20855 [Myxococcota bacterium]